MWDTYPKWVAELPETAAQVRRDRIDELTKQVERADRNVEDYKAMCEQLKGIPGEEDRLAKYQKELSRARGLRESGIIQLAAHLRQPIEDEVSLQDTLGFLEEFTRKLTWLDTDLILTTHPSTLAQLSKKLPMLQYHSSLRAKYGQRVIQMAGSDHMSVDEIQLIDAETLTVSTKFIPPEFLTQFPGAAELYNQVRQGGLGAQQALLSVVDTLNLNRPAWVTPWFGENKTRHWLHAIDTATMSCQGHASAHANREKQYITALDLATSEEQVAEAVSSLDSVNNYTMFVWNHWANLTLAPEQPHFDVEGTYTKLCTDVSGGLLADKILCHPSVFSHLVKSCNYDTDGRCFVSSGGREVQVMLVDWIGEDVIAINEAASLGVKPLFLPPVEYTRVQAEAYIHAREQGINREDALATVPFTVSETTRKIPQPGSKTDGYEFKL